MRDWDSDASDCEEATLAASSVQRADRLAARASLLREIPARLLESLRSGDALVVILVVPDPGWCRAILSEAKALIGPGETVDADSSRQFWTSQSRLYLYRDGTERLNGRRDLSLRGLAEMLGNGVSVVAVAADTALLPHEVVVAADHVIHVRRLRAVDVRRVIRMVTDSSRRVQIADELASACSLEDLAASVRPSSRPVACAARLTKRVDGRRRSAAVATDVPRLEELPGNEEARDWGLRLVRDVAEWRAAGNLSVGRLTRSLLLAGPPGVGKSLFARALARSAGIPVLERGYADWSTAGNGYLNEVTAAMRASFSEARTAARLGGAILFIDELDSFASRESLVGGRNDGWWTAVGNALLTLCEMGSLAREGVVLIGATNYPNRVDPALRRSGRLDTTIHLRLPSAEDLGKMLRFHLGQDLRDDDVESLARGLPSSTGADAARWVREARDVARAEGRSLAFGDLVARIRPAETRSPALLRSVAYHEAGHAVVAHALGRLRVTTVSLVPSPSMSGMTVFAEEAGYRTREEMETDVVVLLAGRAADERFAAPHTGSGGLPYSDLARATEALAALRCSFGMGGSLAYLAEHGSSGILLRDDPALRQAVEADLARLYARAQALVAANADAVAAVAEALVERRVLSGEDVDRIVAANSPRTARKRGTRH